MVDENKEKFILKVTDCAGDDEYVFLTTISITDKSLNVIMFDVTAYKHDQAHYYPQIGCYVDIVLSQTRRTAICLVASHYDEEMQNDATISRQINAEFEKIFIEVEKQIRTRTEKWNEESKVTLISDPATKVFILTNENKDNTQKTLTSVFFLINKSISSLFFISEFAT